MRLCYPRVTWSMKRGRKDARAPAAPARNLPTATSLSGTGAVVREDDGTFVRPRGQAWGNEAQRAVLHAIAEDVARRSSHRVAAIEVLRADGNLEFVAIAG